MADDGIGVILVLLKELFGTRKGNLVDVFVDFISSHSDTAVADSQGLGILVDFYADGNVAQFAFVGSHARQGFELLDGIDCIRHDFTEENFLVAVKEFLDYGEDVVGRYPNVSGFHRCMR